MSSHSHSHCDCGTWLLRKAQQVSWQMWVWHWQNWRCGKFVMGCWGFVPLGQDRPAGRCQRSVSWIIELNWLLHPLCKHTADTLHCTVSHWLLFLRNAWQRTVAEDSAHAGRFFAGVLKNTALSLGAPGTYFSEFGVIAILHWALCYIYSHDMRLESYEWSVVSCVCCG